MIWCLSQDRVQDCILEQVAYSECKTLLLSHAGVHDGVGLHFTAGLGAGLAATVLGSPWDVIGTRLMARSPVPGTYLSSPPLHKFPRDSTPAGLDGRWRGELQS